MKGSVGLAQVPGQSRHQESHSPTTACAIAAATGNMYNGLWYPIVIAATTFVIGTLFIRQTKDVDIFARD